MKKFPASVKIGAQIMFEFKAQSVELLDLQGLSSVVDWYLVATCESTAQMQAILDELQKAYKQAGGEPAKIEYKELTRWAVLDAGDIMVHLFESERRAEVALKDLWSKAQITTLNEEDFVQKKKKAVKSTEFV
jgi:ribosome-associated protein